MTQLRLLAACAATAAIAMSGLSTAIAQGDAAEDRLRHIAPHDRPAHVKQLIARQEARRMAGIDPAVDVTPPVITAFNAGTALNLTKPAAAFKFTVKATDDLSGVRACNFSAYGPHNQLMSFSAQVGMPVVSFSVVAGHNGSVVRLHEPGAWKFRSGYCYDAAGNYGYVDEAALDSLGNTSYTVVNSAYDLTKPTFISGKVSTGAVSLSSHAKGTTDQDPYVGARLEVADTGDTALAGVKYVYAYFCKLADPDTCMYLYGSMSATAVGSASLIAGTQVSAGLTTGDYPLNYVSVYDHAGNYTTYQSTLFGGATDFTPMFGGVAPVIKLKP